jgi:hypothetical protein
MKVIYNSKLAKWLTPLGTCHTITIMWWILTEKSKEEVSERLIRHELTHVAQWNECFIVGSALSVLWAYFGAYWAFIPSLLLFYMWYAVEWLVRFIIALCDRIKNRDWEIAYKNTVFEQEANAMEEKNENERLAFGWMRYYKKGGSE